MKLFGGLVLICFLVGCQDSAVDVAVQSFGRDAAESIARQHVQSMGFGDDARLWGDTETIKPGVHRVYFKQGQDKVRVRVEHGKVVDAIEF